MALLCMQLCQWHQKRRKMFYWYISRFFFMLSYFQLLPITEWFHKYVLNHCISTYWFVVKYFFILSKNNQMIKSQIQFIICSLWLNPIFMHFGFDSSLCNRFSWDTPLIGPLMWSSAYLRPSVLWLHLFADFSVENKSTFLRKVFFSQRFYF